MKWKLPQANAKQAIPIIIFFLLFLIATPHKSAMETALAPIQLRILETTDLHGNILDYDYDKNKYTNEFGLVRTATLIKHARQEVPNSLLFDNGDLLQGNLMAEYVAKVDKLKSGIHPIFKAMNLLDYDAATLGNHDFHFGFDFLHRSIKGANFPYVNANLYINDYNETEIDDINFYKPYTILKKKVVDIYGINHTLKIGVIGFVIPDVVNWEKQSIKDRVKVRDIVATAEHFIPIMKEKGADIIIALTHSGIDPNAKPYKNASNAVIPLSKVPGIDVILTGHQHQVFPDRSKLKGVPGVDTLKGTINGVATVEAGSWGNYLGVIDLTLDKIEGKWTVTQSHSRARPIYKIVKGKKKAVAKRDEEIANMVKEVHKKTKQYRKKKK